MISTVGILSSSSSSCVQLLTLSNPSPHFDTTLEKVFNARQLLGFLSKAKTWPLSKLPREFDGWCGRGGPMGPSCHVPISSLFVSVAYST